MLSRNQEQEKMMQVIYSYLLYEKNNDQEYDLQSLMEGVFEQEYSDIDVYPKECVIKTLLNKEDIDQEISSNLSEKLKLSRINLVAHAILLLSIAEVKIVKEINKSAMINVAVELAKKYLDDGEYRFINAVLDKIL